MTFFLHEQLYRDMAPATGSLVTICGAGAIGANMAESLARMGLTQLRLIDRDRVEAHNLSTQPYTQQDVGAAKARVLTNTLYRAVGARIEAQAVELNDANAPRLLAGSALVIDAFDNLPSRGAVAAATRALGVACLHLALGGAGDYGCGLWEDAYWRSAGSAAAPAGTDQCDYPLARPLALLVAAAGTEAAVEFLRTGNRRGFEVTLRDLRLSPVG